MFRGVDVLPNEKSINEAVCRIVGSTKLEARGISFPSHYKKFGFMVKYGVIPKQLIRAAKMKDMKARFSRANPRAVFNSTDVEHIRMEDAERFQKVTKEYEKVRRGAFTKAQKELLETCEEEVVKIVRRLLPENPSSQNNRERALQPQRFLGTTKAACRLGRYNG